MSEADFSADPPRANADVWVIVRCFNEASRVGDVVASLRPTFPNIVGVDDGSSDGSGQVMAARGATVLRHAINLGAGAALQTGIEFALSDPSMRYVICFDADGQHRSADAASMIERMRAEPVDILIGSRFLKADDAPALPTSRRLLLKAARVFERALYGVSLSDAHNGLRVFSRAFASTVDLKLSDMAYASELVGLIAASGLSYAEHPVTIDYSEYSLAKGQRSINSVNIAVDACMQRMLKGRR